MRKVAIVGTAPSHQYAPVDDLSYEIWCVGYHNIKRADRWIEPHRLQGEDPERRDGLLSELVKYADRGIEIMMMFPHPDIKSTPIPAAELIERFGTYFMSSSFSWAMALAIHEGVDEIALFGVDMEFGTEYRAQRSGLRHFVDLARFAGIEVSRLVDSGIAYEPVPYPAWQDDPLHAKTSLRLTLTEREKNKADAALTAAQQRVATISAVSTELMQAAAAQDLREYTDQRVAELGAEMRTLNSQLPLLRHGAAYYEGALEEQRYLQDYLKP